MGWSDQTERDDATSAGQVAAINPPEGRCKSSTDIAPPFSPAELLTTSLSMSAIRPSERFAVSEDRDVIGNEHRFAGRPACSRASMGFTSSR